MKRAVLAFAIALAGAVNAEPSLVLLYGKVFTADPAKPWAEAIAIDGSKIVAVGTSDEIAAMAGAHTQVVDLGRRVVIPGINDAHTHPGGSGPSFGIDLGIDPTWAQLAPALANAADETPSDVWISATIGATVLLDLKVDNVALDAIAPKRKVRLVAFTGHGMILSSAAMNALGIAPDAKDPEGGWFGRDANGRIDGRAFEYAQYVIERKLADESSDADVDENVRSYAAEALRYGITSVQAMPVMNEKRFAAAIAKTPLRVRTMRLLGDDREWDAVKYILDGTPIERNAALRSGEGRLNFDEAAITRMARDAAESHKQLLFHVAGDRTAEVALRAFEKFPKLERPRLEHGDGVLRDLVPLAKKTGAIVVQNPAHFPFGGTYPKSDFQPFRSLLDAGVPIAIGSDGPMNPGLNILLATERGPESLTREQAVIAYTRGSAYAEMKERAKGTIAPGMLADLAVLSQDIFEVPADALPDTTSVLTIIDGRVVHDAMH